MTKDQALQIVCLLNEYERLPYPEARPVELVLSDLLFEIGEIELGLFFAWDSDDYLCRFYEQYKAHVRHSSFYWRTRLRELGIIQEDNDTLKPWVILEESSPVNTPNPSES